MPTSSTRKRRPINIEGVAMKLLTFFYTLLNKKEIKYFKQQVNDMGKKKISEIVAYMNHLKGLIQQGGAGSSMVVLSSPLKFCLLLVCLLYINTRVGASIESPKIFEKMELFNKKGDKKSLNLDHSQVWKDTMSVMGTSTDVKRIYTEVDDTFIKKQWTGLQEYYPGEAAKYEQFYKLYEADGCKISESIKAPYRFGLDPTEVISKVVIQLNVLKDARALSNDDYGKLVKIVTKYVLELPKNELTQKIVCDMQRHTLILLFAQDVSNRMVKETQAQLDSKPNFTEPNTKSEVNGMFKQIIDYFKGSSFIIVLLGIFGLGYSFLNMKRGKSRTVKGEPLITAHKVGVYKPEENKGIPMLQDRYGSSSDDEKAPAQASAQAPAQASEQASTQASAQAPARITNSTADLTSEHARALDLPFEFSSTKNRHASRGKVRPASRGKK